MPILTKDDSGTIAEGFRMSPPAHAQNLWIQRFHARVESRVQLICFPHAGGSASYYFPFSQLLSPGVEILGIQYPGRQGRILEPLIDNIPELTERIFEVLDDGPSSEPFAFFGHSMGAILAFEVAQRFKQRMETDPLWLFVSGRRAPSRYRDEGVHLRDDSGRVAELRRLGGTDPRFLADEELLASILPVARNDYKAIETYVWAPGPPLNCPITAFVGDSDPQTTIDEASAWAEHTSGAFDLRVFPGGHFYIDAHRSEVIGTIAATLDAASQVDLHGRSTS